MSSEQVTAILIALIVAGVATMLLLAGAIFTRRGRSESRPAAVAAAVAEPPASSTPRPAPSALVAPAEVPATAPTDPGTPEPAATLDGPGSPDTLAAVPGGAAEFMADDPAVTTADREAAVRRANDPREQEVIEGFLSIPVRSREAAFAAPREPTATGPVPPDLLVDDETGLDSRAAWDRVLAEENARYVRYRRPVGIVVAELDGLNRFEAQFGGEAARRILGAVGDAMRRTARRTDHVAHAGEGRFLVLLPETDEIQAINYVERVRGECERWLEAGAVALHVSLGWASPSAVGELDSAQRTAEERMYAERRRQGRGGAIGTDAAR